MTQILGQKDKAQKVIVKQHFKINLNHLNAKILFYTNALCLHNKYASYQNNIHKIIDSNIINIRARAKYIIST